MTIAGGSLGFVDPACPVEWSHRANNQLVSWWTGLPNPGWWGGATLRDLVCGGKSPHNGTSINGAGWATGRVNSFHSVALASASSQYVSGTGLDLANTAWSVSVWFNPSTWTSGTLFGLGSVGSTRTAIHLRIVDKYIGSFNLYGDDWAPQWADFSATPTWNHLLFTFSSNFVGRVYANGRIGNNSPHSFGGFFTGNTTWNIGNNPYQSGPHFDGKIADVRVYNRELSATEAWVLYDQSRRGYPDLLRWVSTRTYFSTASGITFDAASNSGYQAAQSTYSWSHTCTGTDRFLAVDVSLLSAGSTVSGITYNSVALSLIAAKSTVTSFGRIESWGLANPASGSNTIAVTLSGSIASSAGAVSYAGVHQTVPTEGAATNQATNVGAADATVDVTSVADQCWIHAAVATDDTAITAGQTTRNNVTGAGGSGADEDFGPQAAATKTMNYTNVGALATWAIAGYAIRPTGASAGFTPRDWTHSPMFQPFLAM